MDAIIQTYNHPCHIPHLLSRRKTSSQPKTPHSCWPVLARLALGSSSSSSYSSSKAGGAPYRFPRFSASARIQARVSLILRFALAISLAIPCSHLAFSASSISAFFLSISALFSSASAFILSTSAFFLSISALFPSISTFSLSISAFTRSISIATIAALTLSIPPTAFSIPSITPSFSWSSLPAIGPVARNRTRTSSNAFSAPQSSSWNCASIVSSPAPKSATRSLTAS
ncbi:hypothetical protein QBC39DRAFT_357672 [Podospora conica]|nr:hypothetical protein QBC39DRAFT_357672 [Schizothecium conicum]